MDVQGEGFFDASKTSSFEPVGVGEGVAEDVLVYAGGVSSIDSQGRCVGSEGAAEESPAKNHLFPIVSVVVAVEVETEVVMVVAVNVEKRVVVTGSWVTKLASFRTAKSL
jgi:hypothetical protein